MKKYKRKLFLIAIALLLLIGGQISVRAECYKHCKDSKCSYVKLGTSDLDVVAETVCEEHTGKSHDSCIERAKKAYVLVDSSKDYLCDSTNIINNYDEDSLFQCGNGLLTDVPKMLPNTVHIIYMILQIAVPILLVIFGSIDLVKGIIGQKDDEIKKGQQIFIKRLITGILVFFIFSIVKLVVSFVNSDSDRGIDNVMDCVNCFISFDCYRSS